MEGPLRLAGRRHAPLAERLLRAADRGLHGLTGTVTVETYRGENPL